MVYGIFTAGQRTWGGPRADAGAADSQTTPQQAIEIAKATGDELNVIPETFKPAIEARHPGRPKATALQPSAALEEVFVSAEKSCEEWYTHPEGSQISMPELAHNAERARRLRPVSFDSAGSSDYSITMPRRLASMLGEEERRNRRSDESSGLDSTNREGSSRRDILRHFSERGLLQAPENIV